MKKAILFLLPLLLPMMAGAQGEVDTVKVIDRPEKVIFTESANGLAVDVHGSVNDSTYRYTYKHEYKSNERVKTTQRESKLDWNINYPFQKSDTTDSCSSNRPEIQVFTSGFYCGFGWNHVDKAFPDFRENIGHEYEFGILNLVALGFRPWKGARLSLGFGLESRRYHMHHYTDIAKDADGMLHVIDFPEGASRRNTNIHIFTLQFPLMLRQVVYKQTALFAGGVMNVNTGAHYTSKYRLADKDFSIVTRDLHQRKVTFDIVGGVSFDGFGFYLRYRPQNLFKSGFGPKMSTISTGIMLAF